MPKKEPIASFLNDFRHGILAYKEAYEFIKENRLWEGVMKYKGIVYLTVFVGLVLGVKIFTTFSTIIQSQIGQTVGIASAMSMVGEVAKESYNLLFMGGMKYVVLIFLEIIIFHFVRRTLEIKMGKDIQITFKGFVAAEIRMFKVILFSYILESIMGLLVGVGLGIMDVEFLKVFFVLLIQTYFLGFVFIDNYNELLGMGIRKSEQFTRQFAGISIAIGLVAYLLLLIPVVGSLIAPFIGGVAATLAMYDLYKPNIEDLNKETLQIESVPKEEDTI
jgi:hypothetical protein